MDSNTYKKIHEAQIQRLKAECEKRVATGIIVAERYNPEWIKDCDKFIAHRCKDMARKGFVQVLDEAVHQMATDYFNDELHGKWKRMKFEGLGDCKNDEDDGEEVGDDEKERLKMEIAKKAAEKVKKEPKIEKKPVFAPDPDQYDLFALAGV